MMTQKQRLEDWLKEQAARTPASWVFQVVAEYQLLYGPPPERLIIYQGLYAQLAQDLRLELNSDYETTAVWFTSEGATYLPMIVASNFRGTRRHAK